MMNCLKIKYEDIQNGHILQGIVPKHCIHLNPQIKFEKIMHSHYNRAYMNLRRFCNLVWPL